MAKRKSLSKGLDEIFGQNVENFLEEIASGDSSVSTSKSELPVKEIRPNPYQPRKEFDEQGLNELADSIRENGVFQPILVRKATAGYELVAGERRLRASKLAGKKTIPVIIVDFNDQQMMEISLLENIQRKDLTPIEEASAYSQLIKKFKYTQEQLAARIGKSRANIANMLRLLNLPEEIQKMVNAGKLSYGHARALLSLDDESKMLKIAKDAVSQDLSVRQVEELCSKKKSGKKADAPKKETKDPYIRDVENRLIRKFGTKVEIQDKCISIKYNGVEDLNRILEILNVIED